MPFLTSPEDRVWFAMKLVLGIDPDDETKWPIGFDLPVRKAEK
mgnify:CR=1 FL=1